MPKNKKKSPGRPKKEFISKKPKTTTKAGPGRPRKNKNPHIATNHVSPAVVGFVDKSVDTSKQKDIIILGLFLLSFILFIVSLYFTFMRDKKTDELVEPEIAEITNINTGNVDYTSDETGNTQEVTAIETTNAVSPPLQASVSEQQMIIDFYQAINTMDINAMYTLTDAYLEQSNVFKTYYSRRWLSNFSEIILAPKIVVTNIQETPTNSTNPNIKSFSYTLEYTLASNQQKFTEERSTTLIKKGDNWRIGKLLCETKGCSTMPFFNPDKYK